MIKRLISLFCAILMVVSSFTVFVGPVNAVAPAPVNTSPGNPSYAVYYAKSQDAKTGEYSRDEV